MLLSLALPLNSCRALSVLTYCSLHPVWLTAYGVEQPSTCVRVVLMLFGYSVVVIEKVREVLSVSTDKLAALELAKFIVHHALFEEVKIDLTHVVYRVIGRPRRGRAASRSLRACRSVLLRWN